MAPLSVEEDHYIRLVLLLFGLCPIAVRSFFDKEFPPKNLQSMIFKNRNTLLDLKSKNTLSQIQWNKLFPRNGVPNSNHFDVTLMICLIRNLTSVASPLYGFDILPQQCETTPGSDLARIKWYRNILAHPESGTCTIEDTDFNATWEHIADAVGRLGGQRIKYECEELKSKILDRSIQELLIESRQSQADINELRHNLKSLGLKHAELEEVVKQIRRSVNKFKREGIKGKEVEKVTKPKTMYGLLCCGNCMKPAQTDRARSTNSDSSTESERTDQTSSSPVDQRFASISIAYVAGRYGVINPAYYPNTGGSTTELSIEDPEPPLQSVWTESRKIITVIAVCLSIAGALVFGFNYKHIFGSNIFNVPRNPNVLLAPDKCEKDIPITMIGQRICIPYTQQFTSDPSVIHVTQLSTQYLRAPKVFSFNVSSTSFVQQNGVWIVSFNSSRPDQQVRFVQEKATCDNIGNNEITIEFTNGNVTSFESEIILEEPTLNLSVSRLNDSIHVHCEMTNNCKTISLGLIVNNEESSRLIPAMNESSYNDKKNSSTITADAIIPAALFSGNQTISCVPLMTDYKLAANLTSTMSIPACDGDSCEPNCKDEPYGIAYFQDKHSCNIFHQCSNGDIFLQKCLNGTSWSHSKCTCVHFDIEICDWKTFKFFQPAMSFEKCTKLK